MDNLESTTYASKPTSYFTRRSLISESYCTSSSDMPPDSVELSRQLSNGLSFSTSPDQSFSSDLLSKGHSLSPQHSRDPRVRRNTTSSLTRDLVPFNAENIKVLLLENVNQSGLDILKEQGYQVETLKSSLSEDELVQKLRSETRHCYISRGG